MKNSIIEKLDRENMRADKLEFAVGDTVKVHCKIKEGEKERIQLYSGIVIGISGSGPTETFTVRRISYGEGVERVFPMHSPNVVKVEVERKGRVRRAKLYYLRERTGKKFKVREALRK